MDRLNRPARLAFGDVLRVGSAGLRTRPLRVFLSALGIAIGIAAMTAVVVLGATAAKRRGVGSAGPRVYVGGRCFTVVGVLAPAPLAPELDWAVLLGWPAATIFFFFDGSPPEIYPRTTDPAVTAV